jgi:TIR domain
VTYVKRLAEQRRQLSDVGSYPPCIVAREQLCYRSPAGVILEIDVGQRRDAGIEVFYDNFYPEHLWGKNLTAFLDEIYRKRAKFCVVFVSREYRDRKWTSHELRSAQARALEAKGEEYILPIKVDDTELDGLPPTVGYVAVSVGMDLIAKMLVSKLGR